MPATSDESVRSRWRSASDRPSQLRLASRGQLLTAARSVPCPPRGPTPCRHRPRTTCREAPRARPRRRVRRRRIIAEARRCRFEFLDHIAGEDQQSAYLGDFPRTWHGLDYAGPAFLHTYEDSSDPKEASCGLFHQDGTPKQAIVTVAQVIVENEAIEAAQNVDL